PSKQSDCMLARGIADTRQKEIPVYISNFTNQPKTISKSEVIGKSYAMEDIDDDDSMTPYVNELTPDDINNRVDEADALNSEQKEVLRAFLEEQQQSLTRKLLQPVAISGGVAHRI